MQFKQKSLTVNAKQITEQIQIDGETLANPGDWIVVDEDGQRFFCPDETFSKRYQAVSSLNALTVS